MRILGMVAENYKRLRLIEVAPKGRVVTFSGKPDQGKTSCVDAFLSAVGGKRATQDMPVRRGAKNAKLRLVLGSSKVEWTVVRTISTDGTHSLMLTDASGRQQGRGQSILDDLCGDVFMDPTEFVRMKPKEQVEILRKVAKLEIDVDALNTQNAEDFQERTVVNREVSRLQAELVGMVVQEGLPAEKQDETAIREKMTNATALNAAAQASQQTKERLERTARDADDSLVSAERESADAQINVEELRKKLAGAENVAREWLNTIVSRKAATAGAMEAAAAYVADPLVDVSALATELDQVQLVNREIDKRDRRKAKDQELIGKQRESQTLTRAIEGRDEKKREALGNAKMPVEGLTFDEETVLMNGIPLGQLGEAQQIMISTRIAMAENPKLRVLPILHGESLGDDNLAMLEQLAEENDFQILMAMVDSSGTRGYVIEDGMVKKDNEAGE